MLDSPPQGRSYLASCWEKPLWSITKRPKRMFLIASIIFLTFMFLTFPFIGICTSILTVDTSVIIAFSCLIGAIIVSVVRNVYVLKRGKKLLQERVPLNADEFLAQSENLNGTDDRYISAIREVFGFVYSCSPEKIYPNDTGDSLALLGQPYDPYAFEVVLGTAKKLRISLDDKQVDRICKIIRSKCRTVEELIAVLASELAKF